MCKQVNFVNINRRKHSKLFRLGALFQSTAQFTQGTEFYLSFMPNYPDNPKTTVYVSTKRATTVTISNPNTGYRETYNLGAGVIQPISVTLSDGYVYPDGNETVVNKGLIVESTDTISVYLGNQLDMSFNAANVLPIEALSGNYMAMCYPSTQHSSTILIVSTEDDTYVN
ncbi:MAG: IgGFc-binding protein, partial [Prevotellaceae bacterium]|nr:IgGFc-binding protein [Prevotellaceae bacterium]